MYNFDLYKSYEEYLKEMYNSDFYKAYEDYLEEPAVRTAHDWVFRLLGDAFRDVVDFGCGVFNEFNHYYRPKNYLGVDVNAIWPYLNVDYRTYDLKELGRPTAFVSLFSTEITAPYAQNYQFYERVFRDLPVQAGLVSGFFYAGNKDSMVKEGGGITSCQTLEGIDEVRSRVFSERRITLPVPSKMFGENAFEVWKLFERILPPTLATDVV